MPIWDAVQLVIKTESIRKLSNFNFQPFYHNSFKPMAFFFTLFKGYKCNKLHEITPKKRFLWEPRKQTSKASKSCAWRFYLCFLNSCEIWNLSSWASIRNCLWYYYRYLIRSKPNWTSNTFAILSCSNFFYLLLFFVLFFLFIRAPFNQPRWINIVQNKIK